MVVAFLNYVFSKHQTCPPTAYQTWRVVLQTAQIYSSVNPQVSGIEIFLPSNADHVAISDSFS